MASLSERVAIVTGAGSGIGQGIATHFARLGAAVVVNDVSVDRAAPTVDLIRSSGGRAVACAGDVADRATAEALLATAQAEFGHVNALVNNAGVLSMHPLLDMPESEWDRVMRVNARSAFVCTQVVARHWVDSEQPGKIVNVASVQAEVASTMGLAHYAASKGAVRMLTRVAAAELAPYGINVNAIGPGTVFTGIHSGDAVPAEESAARGAMLNDAIPLGRTGTPADIAELAAFMCSSGSDYMTGQLVMVDGGRNLTSGTIATASSDD